MVSCSRCTHGKSKVFNASGYLECRMYLCRNGQWKVRRCVAVCVVGHAARMNSSLWPLSATTQCDVVGSVIHSHTSHNIITLHIDHWLLVHRKQTSWIASFVYWAHQRCKIIQALSTCQNTRRTFHRIHHLEVDWRVWCQPWMLPVWICSTRCCNTTRLVELQHKRLWNIPFSMT